MKKRKNANYQPLELPKNIALDYAEEASNWDVNTPISVVCTVKEESTENIEQIVNRLKARLKINHFNFTIIRNAIYAIEAPFILIFMLITHPDIETLSMKPSYML